MVGEREGKVEEGEGKVGEGTGIGEGGEEEGILRLVVVEHGLVMSVILIYLQLQLLCCMKLALYGRRKNQHPILNHTQRHQALPLQMSLLKVHHKICLVVFLLMKCGNSLCLRQIAMQMPLFITTPVVVFGPTQQLMK